MTLPAWLYMPVARPVATMLKAIVLVTETSNSPGDGSGDPEVNVMSVPAPVARRCFAGIVTEIVGVPAWLYVPVIVGGAGNARAVAATRRSGSRCFPNVKRESELLPRAS